MTISEYALKFIGHPYIWGGDGSGKCGGGFDCSGLVLECLMACGLWFGKDTTAQGVHDEIVSGVDVWSKVRRGCEKADDLLFFGKDAKHITHVAICIGEGLMVEAGGGGSKCTTPTNSTGMVRVRPIACRKDLVAALRE